MKRLFLTIGLIFFSVSLLRGQNINLVSAILFSGDCGCVCVNGNYSYVASEGNLLTFSVSDPTNLTLIANLPMQSSSANFISGNYIYYTGFNETVSIVDISHPARPTLATTFRSSRPLSGLYKSGNYLYLANYDAGLLIADVSDPANPFRVADCHIPDAAHEVWVDSNYAYVAAGDSGLCVINIADPYHPQLIGQCNPFHDGWAVDVGVSRHFAYVADRVNGLLIFNVSNPSSPALSYAFNPGAGIFKLVISDTIAYAASVGSWLYVLNISNPRSPQLIGSPIARVGLNNMWLSGSYLFLSREEGDLPGGIDILDVSNPGAPNHIGMYETLRSRQMAVALGGNYAYSGEQSLFSIDITNPAEPLVVGRNDSLGRMSTITISGDYAYIAGMDSDLLVFYLDNPSSPQQVGRMLLHRILSEPFIRQPYLYAAAGGDFDIIDISNPVNPSLIASYSYDWPIYNVTISGNLAYLVKNQNTLLIVDIHDPLNPVSLGSWFAYQGTLSGLIVNGSYVYTCCYGGISVIDATDPANPSLATTIGTRRIARKLYIRGPLAYATETGIDELPAIEILDISDIQHPVSLAFYEDYGSPASLAISQDLIYIADGYSFNILHFPLTGINADIPRLPEEPSILQCYPNPFNSQITITAKNIDKAEIRIFDITGRLVDRALLMHSQAVWDASAFPSGLYFARLEAGEKTQNIKMVLLK